MSYDIVIFDPSLAPYDEYEFVRVRADYYPPHEWTGLKTVRKKLTGKE